MKANHAAVLILFVAAAVAAFNLRGQGTSKAPQQRWEYWLIEGHRAGIDFLNKQGEQGWELVSTNQIGNGTTCFYFKRPLQ